MAKNEAKIKFTAETSTFNEAINKSNAEMAKLRAEMKLNDTQMKSTGDTVEGLENKHKILSEQLATATEKTEALSQKVNKAVEIFGENSAEATKLRTQLLNAQTAEEKIMQSIAEVNEELYRQESAASEAATATNKLTDKIQNQQSELDGLKREYTDVVLEYGEASDEAKELEDAIRDLSKELKENKDKLSDASDKADKLDLSLGNAEEAAESSEGGFTILKATIAELAADAIKSAVSALGDFIGYLKELPEETREFRQDMATLNTSFENVGMSSETAKNTWQELYAVFGEDDRAVETANHIARMADEQEELDNWVTITTGVWGTYQDSLPVEGLAEAASETAKTGAVTGVLADALNWGAKEGETFGLKLKENIAFTELSAKELKNLSDEEKIEYEAKKAQYEAIEEYNTTLTEATAAEDIFNLALAECTTEQERQQLITDTLTSMYGDAAEAYRDASGAQLEAKDATAENILAEAALADAVEPVTTKFTELKTALMEGALPAVEAVSTGIVGAIEWFQGIPAKLQNVCSGIETAMSNAGNNIETTLQNANDGVKTVIQNVKDWFVGAFSSIAEWVETKVIQPVTEGFSGLWTGIQEAWSLICDVVRVGFEAIALIISAAFQIITIPFMFIWENCKEYIFDVWETIKSSIETTLDIIGTAISDAWNAIVNTLSPILNTIKTIVTNSWNTIKTTSSNTLNSIKTTVSNAWNTVKTNVMNVLNSIKATVTNAWNAVKTAVSTAMNGVKNTVSTAWNSIKSTVSGVLSGIVSTISSGMNSAKSTIFGALDGIKSKFSSIFESAKSIVTGAISKIKSAFNFSWSLPSLKLPHISVTGGEAPYGIGGKGSLPKFSIKWYAKGGLFTGPTILPANGFGEADPEYALPLNETTLSPLADMLGDILMDRISPLRNSVMEIDYDKLAAAMSQQKISLVYGKREFGRVVREVM